MTSVGVVPKALESLRVASPLWNRWNRWSVGCPVVKCCLGPRFSDGEDLRSRDQIEREQLAKNWWETTKHSTAAKHIITTHIHPTYLTCSSHLLFHGLNRGFSPSQFRARWWRTYRRAWWWSMDPREAPSWVGWAWGWRTQWHRCVHMAHMAHTAGL